MKPDCTGFLLLIIYCLFLCYPGFPESETGEETPSAEILPGDEDNLIEEFSGIPGTDTSGMETGEELPEGPKGYRGIKLGMHIDSVKELLLKDPFFNYKGDPDVSFLPVTNQALIECEGNLFIERAYFQFHDEQLFIIIIVLNQIKLDYYTLFTTLSEKYGASTSLDPSEAVWLFSDVRMSLEKPLTIKYIDREEFEEIKAKGRVEEDIEELSREKFLNDF